jgi:hypothetical protein
MERRLIEQEEALNDAEETIRHSIKQLQLLCAQAGCKDYGELEEVEKKSEHKKQLQEKISAAENRLLKIGSGMSLAELVSEAKGVDADSLPVKIAEIGRSSCRDRGRQFRTLTVVWVDADHSVSDGRQRKGCR